MFLDVSVAPRFGTGGRTVAAAAQQQRQSAGGAPADLPKWVPGGHEVSVRVAAVGLRYELRVFSALLRFADAWDNCKDMPWLWARHDLASAAAAHPGGGAATAAAAGGSSSAGDGAAVAAGSSSSNGGSSGPWDPPPLPYSPEPLEEMVLSTFALHNIPALGELWLPATNFEFQCPGLAISLPYEHR